MTGIGGVPTRRGRVHTGGRSKRVVIGIHPDQHAEADRYAGDQGLSVASYLYTLVEAGLAAERERRRLLDLRAEELVAEGRRLLEAGRVNEHGGSAEEGG